MLSVAVLFLLICALALWLLKADKVALFLKVSAIIVLMGFCAIFYIALDSFLGWSAKESYLPSVVTIRHVYIKEPYKNSPGGIHFLIDHPVVKDQGFILELFGYKMDKNGEPRLFKVSYSRKLHEFLEKEVMPQLKKGQAVRGQFRKGPGDTGQKGKDGKDSGQNEKGGSDSREQELMFYLLEPRHFLRKDEPAKLHAS